MSEMLSYDAELTSMTGGRGSYHMEMSHYDEYDYLIIDEAHHIESATTNALIAHPLGILQGVDHLFTGNVEKVDIEMLQALRDQRPYPPTAIQFAPIMRSGKYCDRASRRYRAIRSERTDGSCGAKRASRCHWAFRTAGADRRDRSHRTTRGARAGGCDGCHRAAGGARADRRDGRQRTRGAFRAEWSQWALWPVGPDRSVRL